MVLGVLTQFSTLHWQGQLPSPMSVIYSATGWTFLFWPNIITASSLKGPQSVSLYLRWQMHWTHSSHLYSWYFACLCGLVFICQRSLKYNLNWPQMTIIIKTRSFFYFIFHHQQNTVTHIWASSRVRNEYNLKLCVPSSVIKGSKELGGSHSLKVTACDCFLFSAPLTWQGILSIAAEILLGDSGSNASFPKVTTFSRNNLISCSVGELWDLQNASNTNHKNIKEKRIIRKDLGVEQSI